MTCFELVYFFPTVLNEICMWDEAVFVFVKNRRND